MIILTCINIFQEFLNLAKKKDKQKKHQREESKEVDSDSDSDSSNSEKASPKQQKKRTKRSASSNSSASEHEKEEPEKANSEPEEGEVSDSSGSSSEEEFNDGYDDQLMGDAEDRARLAGLTEKERETEIFKRIEQRELMKTRYVFNNFVTPPHPSFTLLW